MRVKKAKALSAMPAAWDRGEEYCDPARKEDILGRTRTRLDFGKNISMSRLRPWQKRWNAWNISFSAGFGFVVCCCQSLWLQWPAVLCVSRFCKRCGKDPTGKASGLAWIHGTWCACAHHPAVGMSWGSMGHTASCSSSFSRRCQWLSRRQCRSSPLSLRKRSRRVR